MKIQYEIENALMLIATFSVIYFFTKFCFRLVEKKLAKKNACNEQKNLKANTKICWSRDSTSYIPNKDDWPLAVAAIYDTRNKQQWDKIKYDDAKFETNQLSDYWGISGRETLLLQLLSLMIDGHRRDYHYMLSNLASCPEDEIEQIKENIKNNPDMDNENRDETLWRINMIIENNQQIQSADLIAWDMVRFVMLCKSGATCGFISEKEAKDFILLPAMQLQHSYLSWKDMGEQFLRGRWFWQASSTEIGIYNQSTFAYAVDLLNNNRESPWQKLPWRMQLSDCQWFFVDVLHQEGLLDPLTEEERENAYGWHLTLDDVLKDRLSPKTKNANSESDDPSINPQDQAHSEKIH